MWQPIVTDWMRAHTLTVLTSERMQEIGFFSHSLFFFFSSLAFPLVLLLLLLLHFQLMNGWIMIENMKKKKTR